MNPHAMRPILVRLLAEDGETELLRLRYCSESETEVWQQYHVEFVGMSEAQLLETIHNIDERDLRYVFESSDGGRAPFATVGVVYHRGLSQLSTRDAFGYSTSPPAGFRTWIRHVLGLPPIVVPLERAPCSWARTPRRTIRSLCRRPQSLDEGLTLAYMTPRRKDVFWVIPLLLQGARDADPLVRTVACGGFGEIARVHGYSTPDVLRTLAERMDDPVEPVRKAAARSAAEIQRFVPNLYAKGQ